MNNNIHPEERLQKAMLAFERDQAKKKLRPTLPCDVNRPRPVVERMNELKRRRDEVYVRLLRVMDDGEAVDGIEIAERADMNASSCCNFLNMMAKDGFIHKIPQVNRTVRWIYIKSGKEIDDGKAQSDLQAN